MNYEAHKEEWIFAVSVHDIAGDVPRDVLGEILDLIESVLEGFPIYPLKCMSLNSAVVVTVCHIMWVI